MNCLCCMSFAERHNFSDLHCVNTVSQGCKAGVSINYIYYDKKYIHYDEKRSYTYLNILYYTLGSFLLILCSVGT